MVEEKESWGECVCWGRRAGALYLVGECAFGDWWVKESWVTVVDGRGELLRLCWVKNGELGDYTFSGAM